MQYVPRVVQLSMVANNFFLQLFITGTIVAGRANSMTLLSKFTRISAAIRSCPPSSRHATGAGIWLFSGSRYWGGVACRHIRET
jgi:hypothetical protein